MKEAKKQAFLLGRIEKFRRTQRENEKETRKKETLLNTKKKEGKKDR